MKSRILFVLPALLAVSASAYANEYKCQASGLDTYLVFDDGPGGLDHFDTKYAGRTYTSMAFDKEPAHTFDGSDSDTPDGRYEYAGDELALTITGTDGTVFTYEAKRNGAGSPEFLGTVQISDDGREHTEALKCQLL
jgi:hypothetical protein